MWKEVMNKMPRMKNIDIDFISLVNKGANKQTVKIYKSDNEPLNSDDEEYRGFFNVMKSFFTKEKKEEQKELEKHEGEGGLMKAEDIKKMLDEALNPIKEELKVLKGEEEASVGDEGKEGEETPPQPTTEEIIAKAIKEATEPLMQEVAELKKSRRAPQSLDPVVSGEGKEVKKSYIGAFEGMFN